MQKFNTLKSIPAYLPIVNIDTDMIIPKQFLKTIKRSGLGKNLFYELRYDLQGNIKNDFVLNWDPYKSAKILITGENFGCGSSREHAVWAMLDYGIKCVIAESFADIFYNNCFKNGLLAITLPKDSMTEMFRLAEEGKSIHVDLVHQVILDPNEKEIVKFEIDSFRKTCVLEGLDEIGLSLKYSETIKSFENDKKKQTPWIFK